MEGIHKGVRLSVLPELCSDDVILGQDFQGLQDTVTLTYGGDLPSQKVSELNQIRVNPPYIICSPYY